MYTSLFRELLTYMMEDPRKITFCIHLLFCAKNIERIGDHATNIAETVYYMIEGRPIADERPKDDTTSFDDAAGANCEDERCMSARILIVEDEEPLTLLLRYNLEAEGYEVETVARGDDADTRLQESTPDLILLDWMLPGLSGIELCRRLRARPETETLPIIMLTARGEESERVRGLATGADDYIVKPFSVPELMARVRAMLRRASPERHGRDPRRSATSSSTARSKRVSRAGRDDRARADRIPPARVPDGATRAGCSRASNCSTASGAATSISTSAPSTCMSAGCARRSIRGRRERPDPHRARLRLSFDEKFGTAA